MRWLQQEGLIEGRVLDYGCGRGFDAGHYGFDAYDPNWRPRCVSGTYDTVTCIYVLNVVTGAVAADIILKVRRLLAPGGTAYIAVRRDIPRAGRKGRGCYQRYVTLDAPAILLKETSSFAVYALSDLSN
jgi:SAM-dependent methyltransferase